MKKLIVSGDSCTDLTFESVVHPTWDYSWPKWPEHLAKHLGMELVCLGKGGQGNQFIYNTLLEEITKTRKDRIGLVIAAWTQSHRKDWELGHVPGPRVKYEVALKQLWRSKRVDEDGDILHWVTKSLRTYLSFQILCERYNLPYYHFQMGDLFESYMKGLQPTETDRLLGQPVDESSIYKGDLERDKIRIIHRVLEYGKWINRFIGWPGLQDHLDMGGFNMQQHVLGNSLVEQLANGTIISKDDDHPNAKGHKLIATFLANNIDLPKLATEIEKGDKK